jgi:16S rRNA (cytosine1402-N4)-methyltransferase
MSDDTPTRHVRRPRYRGTHPRAFHEKYKEQNPERYASEVAKVLASGKTPAGTHRSIMVREILERLAPRPGQFAVDATLGYGGHASELLRAVLPGGRLLALDVDPVELPKAEARLRASGIPEDALLVRRSNFAGLAGLLDAEGLPRADVLLADLGLSSMQIDDPARGFTFKHTGPLDLRMNMKRGQPASALLATLDAASLARMLEENADQPDAAGIADAVVLRQRQAPITTTTDLAEAVRAALPPPRGRRGPEDAEARDVSVRRVFQALRERRIRGAGHVPAAPAGLPGAGWPRRHPLVPFRRRPAREARLQGRARGGPVQGNCARRGTSGSRGTSFQFTVVSGALALGRPRLTRLPGRSR